MNDNEDICEPLKIRRLDVLIQDIFSLYLNILNSIFHKRGKMLLKKKMFVIFNTNQKKVKISQQKKILRR